MIDFFCPGLPKPGGSKKAFYNAKLGRSLIVDASNNKDWRASLGVHAQQARGSKPLYDEPLQLTVIFVMPRPKNHFRANGELKPNAPDFHTSRPDATKLLRCLEDALTNVVWRDDSLIVIQQVKKQYGINPGAHVTVETIKEIEN
jgi:crossover junction endodeoxyribonuclease RusA